MVACLPLDAARCRPRKRVLVRAEAEHQAGDVYHQQNASTSRSSDGRSLQAGPGAIQSSTRSTDRRHDERRDGERQHDRRRFRPTCD